MKLISNKYWGGNQSKINCKLTDRTGAAWSALAGHVPSLMLGTMFDGCVGHYLSTPLSTTY